MTIKIDFKSPPEKMVQFWQQKGLNLPTDTWQDVLHSAHDKAFVVAGIANADLLADIRQLMNNTMAKGVPLNTFARDFKKIAENRGWAAWDNYTDQKKMWRLRTIYETNVFSSYAAGRYRKLKEDQFPFWVYRHNESVLRPRPHHLALDGLCLPSDDPFWDTHYPPNGWGCRCYVSGALKQKNGSLDENQEIAAAAAPPEKGWNYAPGKSAFDALANNEKSKTQWLGFIQQKLIKYPPAIAIVLGKKLNKWFSHGTLSDFVEASQKSLKKSNYFLGFPENTAKLEAVLGKENLPVENLKGAFVFLNNNNVRHIMNRHGNDKNPITPADFELLLAGLSNGDVELSGGKKRLKVRFQHKKTKMESIWDFEPDLKTINLVTFYKLN